MSEESSGPAIYQLQLQPKRLGSHIGQHVEVQYRWCSVHSLSYRVKVDPSRDGQRPGQCPLCYRAEHPPRKRRAPKKHPENDGGGASDGSSLLVGGRIGNFSVVIQVGNKP